MTAHFADVAHEHDLDVDETETVVSDAGIDPADDVVDAGRGDFRDAEPTEQDELDELDEAYREVG